MEINTKIKIGIDPDSEKSGVAIAVNGKIIDLKTMRFADLMCFFNEKKKSLIWLSSRQDGSINQTGMRSLALQSAKRQQLVMI